MPPSTSGSNLFKDISMLQQTTDLRDEADVLHHFLCSLDISDWDHPTAFKSWTVNDVIAHLHGGDLLALASAQDPAAFDDLRADIGARRDAGLTRVEETRARFAGLTGPLLLRRWHDTVHELCDMLKDRNPSERLKWADSDMGVRMFTTARQMETWAHGQEIYDLKRVKRTNSDRIKNIAVIGVKTFGFSFMNRDQDVPVIPDVILTAPSGAVWEWKNPLSSDSITGDAVEFCQVVTQVRNIADTNLIVSGAAASGWMQIAQCFAGQPEDPPLPDTRAPQVC
jgi:uncharacterized protein (TIGR03084 family)